ncbi:hypothetical protein PanWU01x14_033320 [Parasponia andersonii]|uniref:Uncharacterized protein n=1 Tax=Parasponia andersonii TaxID=3476 RepID=A0A2P5DTM3_PARAD|nr:hypothetical protein PanWU01x14_033320 [Parasponia andersonii]
MSRLASKMRAPPTKVPSLLKEDRGSLKAAVTSPPAKKMKVALDQALNKASSAYSQVSSNAAEKRPDKEPVPESSRDLLNPIEQISEIDASAVNAYEKLLSSMKESEKCLKLLSNLNVEYKKQ